MTETGQLMREIGDSTIDSQLIVAQSLMCELATRPASCRHRPPPVQVASLDVSTGRWLREAERSNGRVRNSAVSRPSRTAPGSASAASVMPSGVEGSTSGSQVHGGLGELDRPADLEQQPAFAQLLDGSAATTQERVVVPGVRVVQTQGRLVDPREEERRGTFPSASPAQQSRFMLSSMPATDLLEPAWVRSDA